MSFNQKHIKEKCRELSCYLFLSNHFYFPILGFLTLFTLPALITGCVSVLHEEEQTIASEIKIMHNLSAAKQEGTLDIVVFNDDKLKRLDSYQRFDKWNPRDIQIASCSGDKILLAIGNSNIGRLGWAQINSLHAAKSLKSDLKYDGIDKPITSGTLRFRAGDKNSLNMLEMEPLSSIIEIRSIRCDFRGLPYAGEDITDAKAYLININTECSLCASGKIMPFKIINAGKLMESDFEGYTNKNLFIHKFMQNISTNRLFAYSQLICYPNASESDSPGSPFTKLVIEGKIKGNTYYWTIPINRNTNNDEQGIWRNRKYIYDLDIRRKGTTSPDADINSDLITVKMEIAKWEEKADYVIPF